MEVVWKQEELKLKLYYGDIKVVFEVSSGRVR